MMKKLYKSNTKTLKDEGICNKCKALALLNPSGMCDECVDYKNQFINTLQELKPLWKEYCEKVDKKNDKSSEECAQHNDRFLKKYGSYGSITYVPESKNFDGFFKWLMEK